MYQQPPLARMPSTLGKALGGGSPPGRAGGGDGEGAAKEGGHSLPHLRNRHVLEVYIRLHADETVREILVAFLRLSQDHVVI